MVQLAVLAKEAENHYRHRNKTHEQTIVPVSTNFRFLFPTTETTETKPSGMSSWWFDVFSSLPSSLSSPRLGNHLTPFISRQCRRWTSNRVHFHRAGSSFGLFLLPCFRPQPASVAGNVPPWRMACVARVTWPAPRAWWIIFGEIMRVLE